MFRTQKLLGFSIVFASVACALIGIAPAQAQGVLNIYSARHYQTDEALYTDFTKLTGIKINRLDGKEEELVERIKNEGASSPADVLITVDAARLEIADKAGLFQPLKSALIEARIPEALRTSTWAAFSTRARVVVYNKATVNAEWVQTYEDLAHPRLKNQVCVRSGAHPYNLSLGSAMLAHIGEAKTEEWARGLVANFARAPKGGDTDQLKAVAAGECGVAISNSYYLARLMRSTKPEDQQVVRSLGVVWPNQKTWGTHINVSGAGIAAHAPNARGGGEVPGVPGQRFSSILLRRRQQRVAGGQDRACQEPGPRRAGSVQAGHAAYRSTGRQHGAGATCLRPRRLALSLTVVLAQSGGTARSEESVRQRRW